MPGLMMPSFGTMITPSADVVAVAVSFLNAGFVDQPRFVADPCVLVDDDLVEDDVAADSEARRTTARRRDGVGVEQLGAKQHRSL